MFTIYGIKNCDTITKARKWMDDQAIEYRFHDYRVDGIEPEWLKKAIATLGWDTVLNKRGTTYRQLSDSDKQTLESAEGISLLLANPAMIKRPIIERENAMAIGFKASDWEAFVRD